MCVIPVDRSGRNGTYLPSLDGLRALAVLAVVVYHFGGSVDGTAGVTVFFALSGYLITGLLLAEKRRTGSVSLGAFYKRRARRLLPASIVAVVITLIVVWVKHLPAIGRQAQAALTYCANWERFGSHVAYGQSTFAPLTHFWSLAVEEQFYFVFPLLAAVALRFGRRWFALACLVAFVGSAVWAQALGDDPQAYYHTGARVCEILAGSLLAFTALRLPTWIGHVALAALVATIVLFHAPHLLISLLTVAVIAGRPTVLAVRPLRYVGKVSYGLYLFHPIALIIADGSVWIAAPVTIALTLASYYLVEQPVRFRMSWPTARLALLTMSAAALVTAFQMSPFAARQPFAPIAATAAPVIAQLSSSQPSATTTPTTSLPASDSTAGDPSASDTTVGGAPAAPTEVPATVAATTTTVPPPPIRISMAGDSTSPAMGQALLAWADQDPGYEFVPAPDTVAGWTDWPQWGLGRGSCGLMHGKGRTNGQTLDTDDPDNRASVDDAAHAGCDPYDWIPQALATMDLDVLVVTWGPTQMTDFLIDGAYVAPGSPEYDAAYRKAMDDFEWMAATYGTKVLWVAYPDIPEATSQVVDAVAADVATRPWWVDLRPMSRDDDTTPLYVDSHHFGPEAAAQAVALIVGSLLGGAT